MYKDGWIGALLDEYERAVDDFVIWAERISPDVFEEVIDPVTKDEDCRSFKSICYHVVNAGHGYNYYLRKYYLSLDAEREYVEVTQGNLRDQLKAMLKTTEETCNKLGEMDEDWLAVPFPSGWGQEYDAEQILEHAVMHVHRHRRQIQRFLEKIAHSQSDRNVSTGS